MRAPGVSVHVTRTHASLSADTDLDPAERQAMLAEGPDIEDAARTFALIEADCVAYACTAISFAHGAGYDTEIVRHIEAASGSPATTTSTAEACS